MLRADSTARDKRTSTCGKRERAQLKTDVSDLSSCSLGFIKTKRTTVLLAMPYKWYVKKRPRHPQRNNSGATGLYELQVELLSRADTGSAGTGLSGSFGGGGVTARYFANTRLAGKPLVTKVRVLEYHEEGVTPDIEYTTLFLYHKS